jgi:hypothetical protein
LSSKYKWPPDTKLSSGVPIRLILGISTVVYSPRV